MLCRPLITVGAGGHGRVVLDLCRALGRDVAGFLDDARNLAGSAAARMSRWTACRCSAVSPSLTTRRRW